MKVTSNLDERELLRDSDIAALGQSTKAVSIKDPKKRLVQLIAGERSIRLQRQRDSKARLDDERLACCGGNRLRQYLQRYIDEIGLDAL